MPEKTVHFAATVLAHVISADHNILTEESESRWQCRYACGRAKLIHETDPNVIFTQTKSKTRHHGASVNDSVLRIENPRTIHTEQ